MPGLRSCAVLLAFACLFFTTQAQPVNEDLRTGSTRPAKPYRILTAGKQVIIKSTQGIKNVLVWTADGNRILEQRDINNNNYSFKVSLAQKIYFVMVELVNGKRYSEKIGVQ